MNESCGCTKPKYNVIFACSGASDVGGISDQAARLLAREKAGFMSCAAGIAAGIPEILEKSRAAARILAVDGCDKDCAKIILEKEGFSFTHLRLQDLGLVKGESPLTEERLRLVTDKAHELLDRERGES